MPESEDAASDVYVFLDANILLHYQPPEQIDWPELTGGSAVRLVIYPLLLTELAKAKDLHPVRALRDRARKREAQLRDWLGNRDSPIRAGVLPHRDAREPRDLLAELGLDRDVKDDLIIASAVAYLRQGRRVFVATADGGLEMKLEDHGVAVIRPDERLKLAAERDPEEDRADRAERELRGYRTTRKYVLQARRMTRPMPLRPHLSHPSAPPDGSRCAPQEQMGTDG